MKTKSVAIIGFSELTLPFVRQSKADEYWTMSHAFAYPEYLPRIDRLFEIHHRDWYLRGEQSAVDQYATWLAQEHPFPIYMQEGELTPLVPSGVAYPFDAVCADLFGDLLKRDEDGHVTRLNYFKSSAAYAIALAIHEGFSQIELYGVDMASDTEYSYQKDNGEFLLGIALGRGIRVLLPKLCPLCTSALYGYEGVPYVDKVYVQEWLGQYQTKQMERNQVASAALRLVETDPSDDSLVQDYLEKSGWDYLYQGAVRCCFEFAQVTDRYVSRQYIELHRNNWLNGVEYWKSAVNTFIGKFGESTEGIKPEEWQAYLDARASMYLNLGAAQVAKKLIRVIDFRDVTIDLVMEIQEGQHA